MIFLPNGFVPPRVEPLLELKARAPSGRIISTVSIIRTMYIYPPQSTYYFSVEGEWIVERLVLVPALGHYKYCSSKGK